jgi:hypothetical protein
MRDKSWREFVLATCALAVAIPVGSIVNRTGIPSPLPSIRGHLFSFAYNT